MKQASEGESWTFEDVKRQCHQWLLCRCILFGEKKVHQQSTAHTFLDSEGRPFLEFEEKDVFLEIASCFMEPDTFEAYKMKVLADFEAPSYARSLIERYNAGAENKIFRTPELSSLARRASDEIRMHCDLESTRWIRLKQWFGRMAPKQIATLLFGMYSVDSATGYIGPTEFSSDVRSGNYLMAIMMQPEHPIPIEKYDFDCWEELRQAEFCMHFLMHYQEHNLPTDLKFVERLTTLKAHIDSIWSQTTSLRQSARKNVSLHLKENDLNRIKHLRRHFLEGCTLASLSEVGSPAKHEANLKDLSRGKRFIFNHKPTPEHVARGIEHLLWGLKPGVKYNVPYPPG
jgi:hypothetical protein